MPVTVDQDKEAAAAIAALNALDGGGFAVLKKVRSTFAAILSFGENLKKSGSSSPRLSQSDNLVDFER